MNICIDVVPHKCFSSCCVYRLPVTSKSSTWKKEVERKKKLQALVHGMTDFPRWMHPGNTMAVCAWMCAHGGATIHLPDGMNASVIRLGREATMHWGSVAPNSFSKAQHTFPRSRFTAVSQPGSPTLRGPETVPHIDGMLVMDVVKYNYCGAGRGSIHTGFNHDKVRLSGHISVVLLKS